MASQRSIDFVLAAMARYVPPESQAAVLVLPMVCTQRTFAPDMTRIRLPDWAADLGTGAKGALLVPAYCVTGEGWENCDWWQAAFSFLTGEAERHHEATHGPVHSYAFRLPENLAEVWEYAWVNRMALFLRRWAARHCARDEEDLFGPLSEAEILLTHDVDALEKNLPIRAKALAFDGINAVRLLSRGSFVAAFRRCMKGIGFFIRPADYNFLEHISALEKRYGRRSTFNVHGAKVKGQRRSFKKYLMDPNYDIASPVHAAPFRALSEDGFTIGIHPSFDTFDDASALVAEMQRVEAATGHPVREIRQHWLRFTWAGTWRAQEAAGLTRDTTLGFNDRPGFRNGGCVAMPAWLSSENRSSKTLESLPLVLMDSHLFDYEFADETTRRATIDRWLDEVKAVGGIATVVWHQRVFHPRDYGWGDDYAYLLSRLRHSIKETPDG